MKKKGSYRNNFFSVPNLRHTVTIKKLKANSLKVKLLDNLNHHTIRTNKIISKKIETNRVDANRINSRTIQANKLNIKDGIKCITFIELKFIGLTADDEFQPAPSQNTSLQTTVMYMVANRSSNTTIEAQVEVSPNNSDFFLDTFPIKIEPGKNHVFIPLRFAKFTRISFRSIEMGKKAMIDIYFQAQKYLKKRKKP